nr:putative ribonuclease H-like domain-containing protein [Tanacetum cinerariifolium]
GDFNNLETSITVNPIPTTKIHKDHLVSQIIGDLSSTTQTTIMTRVVKDQCVLSQMFDNDFHTCMFVCFLSQEEPKRVHQALKDPSWIKAMQEELLQFKMQKVWVLVDFPHEKRAIGTKWVYRNKKDERGIVIRNKARLVTQGHTQEEGIDYEEVFSPVARIEAIRLFLAYASFMRFMVYQMDVKSAILYVTIEEEVYVCQPLGFEDPDHPDKVYKVVKALYGLHQAPRACRTCTVQETLHVKFLENKPNLAGSGPTWLFDIDNLTRTMTYQPVIAGTQTNPSAGFQDKFDAKKAREEVDQQYVLFPMWSSGSKYPQNNYEDATFDDKEHEFDAKKPESEVILSPSSSAQSRKQDDKTKKEAKGKNLVESFKGYRDLSGEFEDCSNNSTNEDPGHPNKVYKMVKELFGLHQAPRAWYETLATYLLENGFQRASTPVDTEKPLLKDPDGKDVDVHTYKSMIGLKVPAVRRKLLLFSLTNWCCLLSAVSYIKYALTVNLNNYVSCIKQFWNTVAIKQVNDITRLQAPVDKKKVVITEAALREVLRLYDAGGVDCLPNEEIFIELARMGYEKPSTKLTFYKAFFSSQ